MHFSLVALKEIMILFNILMVNLQKINGGIWCRCCASD